MSTKRILGITVFGVLFIAAVIGSMFLTSFLRQDVDETKLPDTPAIVDPPGETAQDVLNRVEVTPETIQAVVATLSRPETYSRNITIETFWEGGQAAYDISVSVKNGMTSLRTQPPVGAEKRIIITADTLYIWYRGDRAPYISDIGSAGDGSRTADEWQMLVTYEDLLELDKNIIIEAGNVERQGEDCVYAVFHSPVFGYLTTYYVSIDQGLVTCAEEYNDNGDLVYIMTAGEYIGGEVDPAAFVLPDGTDLMQN